MTTFLIPLLLVALEIFGKSRLVSILLVVLTLLTVGTNFRPQDFLGRKDDYFLNRYIPAPVVSEEYKKTQEEYLRLPKYTHIRPDKNYPRVEGEGIKKVTELNGLDAIIEVESTRSGTLSYNKYFFPGWTVEIDGQKIALIPGFPFGQITIPVSVGSHKIEIAFKETGFKKTLDAISLLAFLVSLMLAKLWISSKKHGRI